MKVSELHGQLRDIVERYSASEDLSAWPGHCGSVYASLLSELCDLLPPSALGHRAYTQEAKQVLQYLNARSGRQLKTLGLIPARLRDVSSPASVAECTLVIDWLLEGSGYSDEWIENCLNHTTPFRPDNFDKYLDAARRWRARCSASTNKTLGGLVI